MSPLSFRVFVYPCCVTTLTRKRVLKDFFDGRVWLVLFLVHHECDIASGSSCGVEARSVRLVLRHRGVGVDTGIGRAPLDVAAGLDRVVQVGVGEDGAMQRVPRSAECALASKREGRICLLHLRIVDVYALMTVSRVAISPEPVPTYLLTKVVLVPFQAVMPPPQFRKVTRLDWIQAVPKP